MRGALRVLVTPWDENPYQRLLYGEMSPAEAVIRYPERVTGSQTVNLLLAPLTLAYYRLRGYRLLHIHWIFNFSLPWARDARAARIAMQWWFAMYLRAASVLGYGIVWTAHDMLPHERVFFDDVRARATLLERTHNVIALSEVTARQLEQLGAKDVRVIPFGPYLSPNKAQPDRGAARRLLGLTDDDFLIVSIGKVERYKGVEHLLDAASRLPATSRVKILVAGACQDAVYREALSSTTRSGGRVTMRLEWLPDDEFAVIMHAADFAAMAFVEVTNSSSVLTAFTFGLPVIIPDLVNLRDLPDECVLRYDPKENGLLDAIERASALSLHQRSAMVDAALAYAHTADWRTIARATLDLYSDVLARV